MTAPSRALLLMSVICVASVVATPRAQAQPAPLPSAPTDVVAALLEADGVANRLGTTADATACAFRAGLLACECLRDGSALFGRWSADSVENASLGPIGGATEFRVASADRVDGIWVLRGIEVYFPTAYLLVEEAHIDDSGAVFAGLVWHDPTPADSASCSPRVATTPPIRARAKRAAWADNGWTLQGYRVGPWPVSFGASPYRLAPGLLPPTVRVVPDAAELEAAAHLWGGIFVFAAAGVDAPVSAGLGVVTQRQSERRILRGWASVDDGIEPVALGDIAIGEKTHLRAHLEHPSDTGSWRLRRAEAGGFFRPWRVSHIGAAASGDAHALQLSGSVVSDPLLPEDQWSGLLTYGTSFNAGRWTNWTVDLEHLSLSEDTARHSTTTALGVTVPLGRNERAWIAPGADILANYGAVTVARGFDASTTISALARIEAGLAFEGRTERAVHRIAPVVRAGLEVGGVQQRQNKEGAPDYLFERPERWRWATAILEQSLEVPGLRIDLPIGVFGDAIGDQSVAGGIADARAFTRVAFSMQRARVDVAAVCQNGCDVVRTWTSARIAPHHAWALSYALSDLSDREAAVLFADQLTERGFTAVRLIADETSDAGFSHFATIRMRRGPLFAAVQGRFADPAEARGIGAELGWTWHALGWGLGLGAAWAPVTEDWALNAGFTVHH